MRRPARIALLTCAVSLLGTACAASDLRLDGSSLSTPRGEREADLPDIHPDDAVEVALDDLASYWATQMPVVYDQPFTPLAGGKVPYGPDSPVPQCGPDRLVYEDVAANALYCPDEDLIAWDRVALIPELDRKFGPLTVGIVMAHEFAHAIQARADVLGDAVTLELQADCFAGAWAADAAERIDVFTLDGGTLDQAIGGFLELRDTVGVGATDPQAHGSGFDRVSAFQDGFEGGNEVCAAYEDEPPPVVAIPFVSLRDLQQEGNLPLDELIEPLVADLESFFSQLVRSEGGEWDPIDGLVPVDPADDVVECGDETLSGPLLELASFYCVPDDTIYIDDVELVPSLDEIGDFAFGGEIARQYAFAAQARLGILERVADTDLHADCVTGVFSAAEFFGEIPGEQELVLSPGDLDEIIIAFLAFGGGDSTAFERTAAFRTGFVDDYGACERYLD
jgi:predicted metalloprotease